MDYYTGCNRFSSELSFKSLAWIPEERLYVRMEDMALVTEDGVENLSAFVPSNLDDIERTMKEKGLVHFRPATSLPLKK